MNNIKGISEILQKFFEKQPPPNYGDAESIIDSLFWLYMEHNDLSTEAEKQQLAKLRAYLNLSPQEFDEVFYIISDLCIAHSRSAFI